METATRALIESLSTRPLFAGLSHRQIARIVEAGTIEHFEPGQIIPTEGEPGRALYTILHGSVAITNGDQEGGQLTGLAVLYGSETPDAQYEGDFFGEMSLLDFEPIDAAVAALEPCELLIIPVQALYELFQHHRDIQVTLLGNLARTLTRRLRLAARRQQGDPTDAASHVCEPRAAAR